MDTFDNAGTVTQMKWKLFNLQRMIDELFVDDWLYPWRSATTKGEVPQ
ncbi:hypothetical protein GPA22_11895 [Aromatoleum toluvorans]|uniref:Transposase n=1 Tax=Aromatoleum toluvorans TaxID=92002 RepID=A0ABX1Q0L6_9RHOO|nr:hypothetical protein [Aromatoleum toluvorans]NMG44430.1 hypothetical protein [Aromatoleum toluvorans]